MFSCECYEISQNTYFEEHLRKTVFNKKRRHNLLIKTTYLARIFLYRRIELSDDLKPPWLRKNSIITKTYSNLWITYLLKPTGNYMFKVNNRNNRKRCEIISKVNNEDTRTTPPVSSLLTLNIFHIFF